MGWSRRFYKELFVVYFMKRGIGYIVSVAGIIVMILGFEMIDVKLKFLEGVAGNYIAGVGVIMIAVGVAISLMSEKKGRGKVKGGEEEVPIYEGVGKKRKVVGYRKD